MDGIDALKTLKLILKHFYPKNWFYRISLLHFFTLFSLTKSVLTVFWFSNTNTELLNTQTYSADFYTHTKKYGPPLAQLV
jgi:hypothetical protein